MCLVQKCTNKNTCTRNRNMNITNGISKIEDQGMVQMFSLMIKPTQKKSTFKPDHMTVTGKI